MRAAANREPTLASCDMVDPSIRRRLGNRPALGVTLILAGAVGATTATGLWVSIDSLRGQAEEAGRRTAVTAATAFGTLADPSAANIAGPSASCSTSSCAPRRRPPACSSKPARAQDTAPLTRPELLDRAVGPAGRLQPILAQMPRAITRALLSRQGRGDAENVADQVQRQTTEEAQDGKGNEFSFELRFSEDFPRRLPYKKLMDEAPRVTNGRVTSAKRTAQE